jgi:hypothetical protein
VRLPLHLPTRGRRETLPIFVTTFLAASVEVIEMVIAVIGVGSSHSCRSA